MSDKALAADIEIVIAKILTVAREIMKDNKPVLI